MRNHITILLFIFFASVLFTVNSTAQTSTTIFTDDFNGTLANWNNPTGQGSWTISGGKLVGYYDITCGSTTCPQADLILNDQYQISDNWKATSTFSKFYMHSYGGSWYGNFADFSLWTNSNNKFVISIGEWAVSLNGIKDSIILVLQKWNGSWTSTSLPGSSKTGKFKYPGGSWNADGTNTSSIQKNGSVYKLYFNGFYITQFTDSFLTGQAKIGFHTYGTSEVESFTMETCPVGVTSLEIEDDNVLNSIMLGLKIVERIKSETPAFTIDQNQMLSANYNNCTKIGNYIVYTKTAQSLDRTDWTLESGTAFTGDRFPAGLQIKFAWKADGTVYMGAIGTDDEVLAAVVEGYSQQGFYLNINTMFEGAALQSEVINLNNASMLSGLASTDILWYSSFYSQLIKKIFNRFSKPVYTVFSSIIMASSPQTIAAWPEGNLWCPLPGDGNGTAKRNFDLTFSNPTNAYFCAQAGNDNMNSSYVKTDGVTVAQMTKWYSNFYRKTSIYPASVEIGASISWSQATPFFRMAIVGDGITASNVSQTPTGGLSNNKAPIINTISVYQPISPLFQNLFAWYPFNGNANDESGNGLNGTNNGATLTTDRFGNSNKAYSFNGSQYISVADNPLINFTAGADLTVVAWVNTSQVGTALSKYYSVAPRGGYLIEWTAAGLPMFDGRDRNNYYYPTSPTSIFDGKWHMLTGMRQGNIWSIWVDGVLKTSVDAGGSADMSNTMALVFGAANDIGTTVPNLVGKLDDIRIYNRALVSSEIVSMYHEGSWDLPPSITSFTPTSGQIGTTVTITGTNFDGITANNIVWFGATKAIVNSATSTELVVTVPAGASYQPISVTTTLNGLTGYSNKPFNVTFPSSQIIDATSFSSQVSLSTVSTPQYCAVSDIDGDGKPDLVYGGSTVSSTVSVRRNTGSAGVLTTGSFDPSVDLSTGTDTNPIGVSVADMDGDGKPDIIVANYNTNTVSVFRNKSSSGIISFDARVDFAVGVTPHIIEITDIDGDGKPDIAVECWNSASVSVLRNTSVTGSITTGSFAAKVDFAVGSGPRGISSADFNGDNKPDLVVTNLSVNTISVLINTSVTGLITASSFATPVDFPTATTPIGVTAGDVDGDGMPDIIIANAGSNSVSVLRNIYTSGTFSTSSMESKVDYTTGTYPMYVSMSDIDGDGKPDINVVNTTGGSVSVLKNKTSTGTLNAGSFATKTDFIVTASPYGLAVSDLDGDGKPDIFTVHNPANSISLLRNTIESLTPPTIGTITQPTCSLATGSVVLNGLPASGTWTVTRSPGGTTNLGSGTSTTISGLAAGTYTFTVTNASSLTSFASADVVINAQPATPNAPVVGTIIHPTCSVSTGSVDLSGLPATGTWTLTRTPGGTTTTGTGGTTTISALAANTYTYTVSNGSCTSPSSANIVINAQPATPSAPVVGTITQPTCTVATGSVDLSGLPASGTWTLTRTPGGTTTTGTGTTTTISALAANTYTYTVSNGSCTSPASANIIINAQPATPTAPVVGSITQPICTVATGSVALSGLPASGTWTLTRTPGGTTTTGTGSTTTISALAANTYTYTVSNGSCTSPASANIVINAQPATPSAPVVGTITQPTCTVSTGSVALSGLPAIGTWTLTRTPGGTTTTGTGGTTTISALAANTYTYTVSNGSCTSPASANIVINAQPVTPSAPVVGTITQPTCSFATGSVDLSGLPATGTWTLTRTPGGTTTTGTGTTTTISALAANTYTYTVSNGSCTSPASANIVIDAQPATPNAPVVGTITQPTCTVATGSVDLSGLPASGTWTLTRTPGGTTTTGTGSTTTISALAANTYTYTVSNGSCTSPASANIVIDAQPVTPSTPVVGTITQPTCSVATGSVALSGLPATGTWTLTRTPGGTTTTGTGNTTTISSLATNTYTYTVSNGSCTSPASANIVINAQPATPSAPVVGTITQPTCTVATGSVDLSGLPATGTWTLTRTPGGTTTTGTGSIGTVSGIPEGTFTFTVTNADGCSSTSTGNIVINTQPSTPSAPGIGTIVHPTCLLSTGSIQLTGLPSTGSWTVTRSPGAVATPGSGTSINLSGIPAGSYTYTVTNSSGCISAASSGATVNAPPAVPTVPVVGTLIQPTCLAPTGTIPISGLPASGSWTLTPSTGSPVNGTGGSYSFSSLSKGTYRFTVTNSVGCSSLSTADVIINDVPVGVVPVITKKWNDVLICYNLNNQLNKYQWFKGTTPLTGETNDQFYWITRTPGTLVSGSYRVLTTDKDGCKNYSNTIVIGTGTKSISAYPNPVSENVTIDLTDDPSGRAVISVFNQTGTKVLEFETDKDYENLLHEFSVESLDEGIYFVRIIVNKINVYNTKIIVAK